MCVCVNDGEMRKEEREEGRGGEGDRRPPGEEARILSSFCALHTGQRELYFLD